jgi:hypothetical protein
LLKLKTLHVRRRLARESTTSARLKISRERGFEVVSGGALAGMEELLEAVRELIADNPPEERQWAGKEQLITNNLDMQRLTLDSPFMRFALQRDVLDAVSAYLGVVPLLAYVDVWYSRHSGKVGNSQLFHCDWGDLSQVKVFVHATTVETTSGPLVVVGAATSKRVRDEVRYNYVTVGTVSDDEMGSRIAEEEVFTLVGPPGTVAFVDTSRCFHYGSRVHDGAPPRVLAVFQFFTPFAFKLPLDHRKSSPFQHLCSQDMSPLERMVLGLE